MNMEVIVLNKNHYDMDGSTGASLTIFGEFIKNDYQAGVSISEAPINFDEHININDFPAKYSAKATMREIKNRQGKRMTGIFLSDLKLISKLEFKEILNK